MVRLHDDYTFFSSRAEEKIFARLSEFKAVAKEICKLPSFFSSVIFRKIDANGTGIVTRYVASLQIIFQFVYIPVKYCIDYFVVILHTLSVQQYLSS